MWRARCKGRGAARRDRAGSASGGSSPSSHLDRATPCRGHRRVVAHARCGECARPRAEQPPRACIKGRRVEMHAEQSVARRSLSNPRQHSTRRHLERPAAPTRRGAVGGSLECRVRCEVVDHAPEDTTHRVTARLTADVPRVESAAGAQSGSTNRKRVPDPTRLTTDTSPPWSAIACFTMESPSPVPPLSRERALSTR